MNKKRKKVNKQSNKNLKIFIIILFAVSFILWLLINFLNVLPQGYIILTASFFLIISSLLSIGILVKKSRIVALIMSFIYIIICLLGICYAIFTMGFLDKIGKNDEIVTENYLLVSLKNSNIHNKNDLTNKLVGLLNTDEEEYLKAIEELKKVLNYKEKKYSDFHSSAEALINNEVSAILIDESNHKILKENNETYNNDVKIIYEFSVTVKQSDITKNRNVTKESFNIYISGIDTYGKVTNSSRSDVNILMTINPNTRKINMVHIPRDYYVLLPNKNSKDKLTHAGIYGIETSVRAVEELLDIDVNYYIKLNFTFLTKIVNAVGGIDVDSKYAFTTGIYDENMSQIYTFKKGLNHLNGDEALSFVRERHAFNDGDRVRGENQMLVLKALINKCISPSILKNYPKLLNSLSESFVTNLNDNEVTALIKKQLDTNAKWDMTSTELNGTSSYEYTYSYPRQKLYTMLPDDNMIFTTSEKIKEVYNE